MFEIFLLRRIKVFIFVAWLYLLLLHMFELRFDNYLRRRLRPRIRKSHVIRRLLTNIWSGFETFKIINSGIFKNWTVSLVRFWGRGSISINFTSWFIVDWLWGWAYFLQIHSVKIWINFFRDDFNDLVACEPIARVSPCWHFDLLHDWYNFSLRT